MANRFALHAGRDNLDAVRAPRRRGLVEPPLLAGATGVKAALAAIHEEHAR